MRLSSPQLEEALLDLTGCPTESIDFDERASESLRELAPHVDMSFYGHFNEFVPMSTESL